MLINLLENHEVDMSIRIFRVVDQMMFFSKMEEVEIESVFEEPSLRVNLNRGNYKVVIEPYKDYLQECENKIVFRCAASKQCSVRRSPDIKEIILNWIAIFFKI